MNILKFIDRVCKENDISYFVNYGTLLGAIRHKGFIPWDDDIDICLYREDYDRFLNVVKELQDERYKVLDYDSSDWYFQNFAVIVNIERRGKSTTIVPHLRLENIDQTETLETFLKIYDSLSQFTKMFVEQEKEVTLDGDWADIKETQETEDFKHLNEDGKYGFALGHAHALLNKYLYSPLSKLLNDYDLDVINDWFTYVQLKN